MAQRIIIDCLAQRRYGTDPLATRGIFRELVQGTLRNSVAKGILRTVLQTRDT